MAHNFTDIQPERLLAFDTETTGLPIWGEPSESEQQPHLVQIAARIVNVPERKVEASIDLTIAPDGWTIPDEVIELHGITNERAAAVGVPEPVALAMFLHLYTKAPFRLCYSHTFDARMIRIATKRYSDEATQELWKAQNDQYHDPMLVAAQIMELPPKGRYGWKKPKLAEAYKHFTGKELVGAHTAGGDIDATIELYFALLDRCSAKAVAAG